MATKQRARSRESQRQKQREEMSKGKGKRRRLRNQQLAQQQNKSLQSFVNNGNFAVYEGSSDFEKNSKTRKEDGLSRNMRFIMEFRKNRNNKVADGRERDEEKKVEKSVPKAKEVEAKEEPTTKGNRASDEATTSGSTATAAPLKAQNDNDQSGVVEGGAQQQQASENGRRKKKRKAQAEEDFVFKNKAKDGKMILEQGSKNKKKKKGYLDLRRQRKQEKRKKAMTQGFDEDDDLKYDSRRFFDEVAYEPPDLAIQKSKLFYSQHKGKR